MSQRQRSTSITTAFVLLVLALLVSGCGFFSNPPAPTPGSPGPSRPNLSPNPTLERPATPAPTNAVASITLVSAVGESGDGTASNVAWQGVRDAAGSPGATPSLVAPVAMAELTAAVKKAADDGTTIVLTVGPEAAQAVLAAATVHPATQFFELDQAVPADAPSNVHGLVFDEAEAGYLAGFVAASVTSTNAIGMVGFATTDPRTSNYLDGFRNGAAYAQPSVAVKVAYANSTVDPATGRAVAAGLVKAGADVLVAMPDLAGVGAMREACARKAGVVGLDTDAALTLPDIKGCVVVSVLKRFDVAAREAILRYSARAALPASIMFDVAAGGISLTTIARPVPAGFADRLAGVLAAMRDGPPRPTPAPASSAVASPAA